MSNHFDIKDVYFYYTQIAEPGQKYQTTGPTDKEYKVTVIVSKEQYKEFTTKYPKKKKAPIDTEDFEAQYKTKAPFPDQPMQYAIALSQKAFKADGTAMPDGLRPKVYQFDSEGKQIDITSTLIGNGSKGTVRYMHWEALGNSDIPDTAKLYALLIEDLVPYEKRTSSANVF